MIKKPKVDSISIYTATQGRIFQFTYTGTIYTVTQGRLDFNLHTQNVIGFQPPPRVDYISITRSPKVD